MAQKTTTTFKVTLTYSGPKKPFSRLLKTYRSTEIAEVEELESKTEKIKPQAYFSDTQKLTRAFFKQALEKAELKYAAGRGKVNEGLYNLNYGSSWNRSFEIYLHGVEIRLGLEDRDKADHRYFAEVWDHENPAYEQPKEDDIAHSSHWYRRTGPLVIANTRVVFTLAQPDAEEILVGLFKEWGHKYKGKLQRT